jgi:hypothetical protein
VVGLCEVLMYLGVKNVDRHHQADIWNFKKLLWGMGFVSQSFCQKVPVFFINEFHVSQSLDQELFLLEKIQVEIAN